MSPAGEKPPTVYLKPGEMYFTGEAAEVVTVLGSCLAVTMFHRRRKLAGICHGLLPTCNEPKDCHGECLAGFKYVDCSIKKMALLFDKHKVRRGEIEVKYFGGADMFSRPIERRGLRSVGRQNIITAEQILRSEGLKPQAMDVGGMAGRKIYFYTHTGDVLLKRLRQTESGRINRDGK